MCLNLKGTKEKPLEFYIFNVKYPDKESYFKKIRELRGMKWNLENYANVVEKGLQLYSVQQNIAIHVLFM